jgi:hypothetical protein
MARDYSTLFEKFDADMLKDADAAITTCNLWGWLKEYTPAENKGFMFSNHPNLDKINAAMKYGGHSGSSYAWTMRQMEYIAKNGWDTFCNKVNEEKEREASLKALREALSGVSQIVSNLSTTTNPTPLDVAEASRGVPGFEGQAEAMKKFSEGKMTYAEMRSLCG